jgi:signal peptidase I
MENWQRAVVPGVVAGAAVLLARASALVVRVEGESMVPTFLPGDVVLTVRRPWRRRVRAGDLVVVRFPGRGNGYMIKRVAAVPGSGLPGWDAVDVPAGQVYVVGDGPRSYDSRHFGPLPQERVVAHVVAQLSSPGGVERSVR